MTLTPALPRMKSALKTAAPRLYSFLAALRKSTALFGDIRSHEVDVTLLQDVVRKAQGTSEKTCPLCGFTGRFTAFGSPPRWNAQCPACGALERHRLLALGLRDIALRGAVLHFAPEPRVAALLKTHNIRYTSADLSRTDVDRHLNIEHLDCGNGEYDAVVCSHVLEHVDDRKALRELYRILKPGGLLIAMVPVVEGCARTYEDADITDAAERALHFGQDDHVRVYGADFAQRLADAGFRVDTRTAFGREAVDYGLIMGEKLFLCRKPN